MLKMVNDLGAAAYIMMHAYKVAGKRGKSICFEVDSNDPEDIVKFDELYRDYLNSDFHRFDSCLMSLKKIAEIAVDAH